MGEIGFGFQTNMSSDYMVGNGDVGTEGTDGEKEVNETRGDWNSVLGGPSVTFNGQEKFVSFAMKHPDLLPSANITPQERNEYYESIVTKLRRALGGESGNESVMFDIYAMMDLIQEMSQKLRNALRELRKLENIAIYANIRAQAEIQRESAIIGALAGAVMCGIQLSVVAVGMYKQTKGASPTSKTVGKGAMNSAVNQEAMMKDLKTTAQTKALGPASEGTYSFNKNTQQVEAAKNNYLSAKNDYLRAKETVANGGTLPKGELGRLKSNMETKRMNYDNARQQQVNDLKTAVQNGKISQADFDQTMESMSKDINQLRGISKSGNAPINALSAHQNMMKGMIISQSGLAVGQFLTQLAQSIREIISSKATELQAEQKLTEEQFDQIRDLFSLVQGVIQKSIDTFASVIQKESSVIEGILQHV